MAVARRLGAIAAMGLSLWAMSVAAVRIDMGEAALAQVASGAPLATITAPMGGAMCSAPCRRSPCGGETWVAGFDSEADMDDNADSVGEVSPAQLEAVATLAGSTWRWAHSLEEEDSAVLPTRLAFVRRRGTDELIGMASWHSVPGLMVRCRCIPQAWSIGVFQCCHGCPSNFELQVQLAARVISLTSHGCRATYFDVASDVAAGSALLLGTWALDHTKTRPNCRLTQLGNLSFFVANSDLSGRAEVSMILITQNHQHFLCEPIAGDDKLDLIFPFLTDARHIDRFICYRTGRNWQPPLLLTMTSPGQRGGLILEVRGEVGLQRHRGIRDARSCTHEYRKGSP
mmetsp:Transcript_97832/g.273913  ORF Transcript_97832/g.273913 Transcript_97832/m.273913 type:complete len:343 (+) Transcript_97832:104-1132(+)